MIHEFISLGLMVRDHVFFFFVFAGGRGGRVNLFKQNPGPGFSKLTTSLVNVLLNFQTLISDLRQYFFVEKMCEDLIFSTKNISVSGYKVVKT